MKEVYEVIFSSPELSTVEEYCLDPKSPAAKFANREEDFLKVQNKQGISNRDAILNGYKTLNKRMKQAGLPAKRINIKLGTKLAIPVDQINENTLLTEGIEIVSSDSVAFKAKALAELEANEGYNPVRKTKSVNGIVPKQVLSEFYPEATVWIWCRALSQEGNTDGEIFNVTPFVEKITTNVGKNGGNFQITLAPLLCEYDQDAGKWNIKKNTVHGYKGDEYLTQQNDGFVALSNVLTEDYEGNLKKEQFLFHNILSANDLVFIRFETLELEQQQRIDDSKDFIIDKTNLAGRIYDMIGLIDENSEAVNGTEVDVNVTIGGRDLSKLFIEDGTYFYALEMSQGQLNFAGGSTAQNELMQRVFTNNSLLYFSLYNYNSIENVLKFVIQQLSTIRIVPDNLFESYGERRNKRYNSQQSTNDRYSQVTEDLNQIKNTTKESIANLRRSRDLAIPSKSDEEREIENIWHSLLTFLKEVRTQNVRIVENGETGGWNGLKYGNEVLENNQTPTYIANSVMTPVYYKAALDPDVDESLMFDGVENYIDIEQANPQYQEIWTEDYAKGIWQIIKLVIDKNVTDRRISDSSSSSASGSLLNFIKKICQEPFVEFYMDTYGDMYHLIVRKPPTDKEGVYSFLNGAVDWEDKGDSSALPVIIDIEAEDVLQERLSYDDNAAISWYQLNPQASFIANSSTYSLAYLPAIFFQEYADIWGSRPMQITHNYLPKLPINAGEIDLTVSEVQAFHDLKYLIESHAYIPFTRRGSLTLNGDRRLKIGNICRYKPTGELFFIDNVQQTISISDNEIERTTTLEVSRGMVERLVSGSITIAGGADDAPGAVEVETRDHDYYKSIYGEDVKLAEGFSYFNIVDTQLNVEDNIKETEEVIVEQIQVGTEIIKEEVQSNSSIDTSPVSGVRNVGMSQLNRLSANVRDRFKQLINAINRRGYYVTINSTLRTYAEQAALHRANSKNAKPGHSTHEKGLSVDMNITDIHNGATYTKKEGRYGTKEAWLSTGVPQMAKQMGFFWGGDYSSYWDPVHFELTGQTSSNIEVEEREVPIYETRERTVIKKTIDREKILENFRVNKNCFNFFVRRMQWSGLNFLELDSAQIVTKKKKKRK